MLANDSFFDKQPCNPGRQMEFDWAKAVTILYMIIIHVYETLSTIPYETVSPTGIFRVVLEFLAGPLGAPMFMLAMGVGMVYTRHDTASAMARRGLRLIALGYGLNFFRGALPALFAMLLEAETEMTVQEGLFSVDILIFAGMAFLSIAAMKKLRFRPWHMLLTALLLQTLGQGLMRLSIPEPWMYAVSLFFPCFAYAPFSLFLWLFYPCLGLCFGTLLRRARDKARFYRAVFLLGLTGLGLSLTALRLFRVSIFTMFQLKEDIFYYQTYLHYLFTASTLFLALPVLFLVSRSVKAPGLLRFVRYLSTSLNRIFLTQWLVIVWLFSVPMTLFDSLLEQRGVLPCALLVLLVTIGIERLQAFAAKRCARRAA